MKSIPPFDTTRLHLRALAASDANGVFSIYSDPEVTQNSEMLTLTTPAQAALVIKRFQMDHQNDAGIRWAIALKHEPQIIGTCGLGWHRPNFSAFLSYDFARPHWGQGYATEALQPIIQFAFAGTDLNRLSATTVPDNAASGRVLEKLGFKEEGILRDWAFWKGKFQDLRCYSLLRKDLPKP